MFVFFLFISCLFVLRFIHVCQIQTSAFSSELFIDFELVVSKFTPICFATFLINSNWRSLFFHSCLFVFSSFMFIKFIHVCVYSCLFLQFIRVSVCSWYSFMFVCFFTLVLDVYVIMRNLEMIDEFFFQHKYLPIT